MYIYIHIYIFIHMYASIQLQRVLVNLLKPNILDAYVLQYKYLGFAILCCWNFSMCISRCSTGQFTGKKSKTQQAPLSLWSSTKHGMSLKPEPPKTLARALLSRGSPLYFLW